MSRTVTGGLLALGLCAAAGATPLAAQQGVVLSRSAQGWLGIRFDLEVRTTPGPGEPDVTMVIREVQGDSPAERAGIEPGDTVLRIDGRPLSTATLQELLGNLDPGERVRLTLRRDGRALDLAAVAGRRPAVVSVTPPVSAFRLRPDTVRNVYVFGRPEVRHEGRETHVRSDSAHFFPEVTLVMPRVGAVADPAETVPIEFFLFDSQEAGALRREIARLQRELQRVAAAESRRLQELARARRQIDQNDARLRELREEEARLQVEMARMHEEMERARQEARRQQTERMQEIQERTRRMAVESRRMAVESQRMVEETRAAFRPLSLYAAGQNVVAGARLTDLNPSLAEYFGVERGVLVTEVLDDTPAAEAPLIAGDVIVRVGDVEVSGLTDLRTALVRNPGGTALTVVRKGRRVTVTLPRE